jgi:hypothetical protein
MEAEGRQAGHVKGRVYASYAQAAGPVLVTIIFISFILMQVQPHIFEALTHFIIIDMHWS